MAPGAAFPGACTGMPFWSGDTPDAGSLTAVPLSLVLYATYDVFAGIWSRSDTPVAFSVPMFLTVMV
jgi:hypothetical protein